MTTTEERGAQVLGVGAAACAACCAGPILGFLAAAGLTTLAGVAHFGAVGLLLLLPFAAWRRARVRRGYATLTRPRVASQARALPVTTLRRGSGA